jgi:hypothetical protein
MVAHFSHNACSNFQASIPCGNAAGKPIRRLGTDRRSETGQNKSEIYRRLDRRFLRRGSVANPCLDIQCELTPSPAVATHRRRQCDSVK